MMMGNEEFERKMAFIVNQQAQFTVDMDKLREKQVETDQAIDRLVATQAKTEEVVTRLAYVTNVGFKDVNAKIDALVDSQIALTASQKQTDETLSAKFQALAESHNQTEEEVRKLTITVDRYFNKRSNGG